MSDLQAIATVYEQIDLHLQSQRDVADRAGEDPAPDPVDDEQRINDQAYFVLAWGQLEADIEDACREAIREGQSHEDWRHRRAWSLYNPGDRRLSGLTFENRLTLVVEKGSDDWKRTMQLYNVRNQIAHGDLLSGRIDMERVIQDFFRNSVIDRESVIGHRASRRAAATALPGGARKKPSRSYPAPL